MKQFLTHQLSSEFILSRLMPRVMAAGLVLLMSILFIAPSSVSADPSLCDGLSPEKKGVCLVDPIAYNEDNSGEGVYGLIEDIINIFSIVVGVISVIMIIIGGLKYITSSGDSNNVTSAKNTILYAVIGLVVVAFAQIIVLFVLENIGD